MCAFERSGVDCPHIPLVPHEILGDVVRPAPVQVGPGLRTEGSGPSTLVVEIFPAFEVRYCHRAAWLPYCLGVKVILGGFGQQQNVLVASGTAVFDALRHGVGLRPDDVLPQIPAVRPEG